MHVFGRTCLLASFTATLATVIFFGVVLLITGIVHLTHPLRARSEDVLFRLIGGGHYSLVGLLMVVNPVSGAIGLPLLLGLFCLASAVVILSGWPDRGNWLIGLLLGFERQTHPATSGRIGQAAERFPRDLCR